MVAPLVGAWIEIGGSNSTFDKLEVAPLVGAWIEIECQRNLQHLLTSLLSWERGLKSFCQSAINLAYVAPLVGAWIEITRKIAYACTIEVAPLVGAWIEIALRI